MNTEWVAYAADFVSFLVHKLQDENLALVRDIVIFGSATREDWTDQSDIDLFVDTPDPERLQPKILALLDQFLDSIKVSRYWSLLGTRPEISIHVESIENWPAAHLPLLKDGRVLYGRYRGITAVTGHVQALISWDDVSPDARRVGLHRKLNGYTVKAKRYAGLLEKLDGEKLSKGAILVPVSELEAFKQAFKALKVPIKIRLMSEVESTRPSAKKPLKRRQDM